MRLSDINLLEVGNTIYLVGAIYADAKDAYLCWLPDEDGQYLINNLNMNVEEWETFLKQSDLLETEVLSKDPTGKISKAIVRKSNRQIDQNVSWNVFRRDQYKCRYCGLDNVPLTVDHLVLWEDGGPSIEANLTSACRKCNKTRGNMKYAEWLESPYYQKVSKNLKPWAIAENKLVLTTLDSIPVRIHQRGR